MLQSAAKFFTFRFMKNLYMMLSCCKAKIIIKIVHGTLCYGLFHIVNCQCKKLSCRHDVRGIRHITRQLCRTLPTIREQENLSSFIWQTFRIIIFSTYGRLLLKLCFYQVVKRLIATCTKRRKLRRRQQVSAMRTRWKCQNPWAVFLFKVAVIQFPKSCPSCI